MSSINAVKKEEPTPESHPEYGILNTQKIDQHLWVIKIPDFIFEDWKQLKTKTQVGKIRIEHQTGGLPPKAYVILEKSILTIPAEYVPDEINLGFDSRTKQNQYVFTHSADSGYVQIFGKVISMGNMRTDDPKGMAKAREYRDKLLKEAKKKQRVVQMYDQKDVEAPETTFRRKAIVYNDPRTKRQVKDKTIKKSEDVLTFEIIKLFKENPEWKINDIVERLHQPVDGIRKVVQSIAAYDQSMSIWRIKQESLAIDDE